MRDPLPSIRKQWRACRPELDTGPMDVAGRVILTAALLDEHLRRVFLEHDLTLGSFDVLATLRRQGPPYELTPTALYRELLLTSGAMTHRIKGLAGRGFVERHRDHADRREWHVRLTKAGRSLIDRLLIVRLDMERRLLGALTPNEQRTLAALLSKWLTAL